MRKYLGLLLLLNILVSFSIYADEIPIKLERINIDTHDSASVQRGAKAYASYCLVCHSLKYMERDPFARGAGITADRMPDKSKNWWFGSAPPDLTLIARIRGVDWLYTYLHVFYKDPTRPTGSNNLLLPNSNMPNPFVGIQGQQELIVTKKSLFQEQHFLTTKVHYYTVLELKTKGTYSPDDFDEMITDLVNFLSYASEPKKSIRENLGLGVLIFVAILFILCYLLKREFWKKIK